MPKKIKATKSGPPGKERDKTQDKSSVLAKSRRAAKLHARSTAYQSIMSRVIQTLTSLSARSLLNVNTQGHEG